MFRSRRAFFVCALASVLGFCSAPAQSNPPADLQAETAAVQAVVDNLSAAWNRGDAHAFSADYAQDGSFTNIVGMQLYGREAFERQHDRILTTFYKGTLNRFSIGKLRFIRTDVAIVDVDSELSGVKQGPPGLPIPRDGVLRTKLQMVMTKEAGHWQIAGFHNVAVAAQP